MIWTSTKREQGSAVLAAIYVSACIALLASQVVIASRSGIAEANSGLMRARLAAEAEGGVAVAAAEIVSGAWDLGRSPHEVQGSPDAMSVVVEDERGKAPLNTLNAAQVRALFQAGGADSSDLDALTTAFLDWRDPSRERSGAVRASANPQGGFQSIAELKLVPGVSPALYDTLASSITVSAGDRSYEPAFSTPLALTAMSGASQDTPAAIEARRELGGERTALSTTKLDLAGRALTIRVTVEGAHNSRYQAAWLVELTGHPERAYVVRGRVD